MSHHDKFWEKFGGKIKSYQPDGQPNWAAMEELLDGPPPAPARKKRRAILWASLIFVSAGICTLACILLDRRDHNTHSTAVTAIAENALGQESTENKLSMLQHGNAGSEKPEPQTRNARHNLKIDAKISGQQQTDWHDRGVGAKYNQPVAISASSYPQQLFAESNSQPFTMPLTTETELVKPLAVEPIAALERRQQLHLLRSVELKSPGMPEIAAPSAQKHSRHWYGGMLAGVNNAITDYKSLSHSTLPVLGIFGGVDWNQKWSTQLELHTKYVNNYHLSYTVIRYRYDTFNNLEAVEQPYDLKAYFALEMPIVVKRRLTPSLYLLGGLRPSLIMEDRDGLNLLANNRQEDTASVGLGASSGGTDTTGSSAPQLLRKHDIGILAGIEWAFSRNWSLDVRYNQGLRDLSLDNVFQDNATHLNADLQLTARWKF
ncbi:MAG: PorT family protein [Lewinellaceae bacterium]|nr:PorT family protein [Lewinellaceae bacterium]